MSKLLFEEESYQIRGAAFEVYKEMVSVEQSGDRNDSAAGILQPRKTRNDTEMRQGSIRKLREIPCVPWLERNIR